MKAARELQLPQDLLEQLKAADAQLHEARQSLERSMDDSDYGHQRGVDQAAGELGAAERAVEEISRQIHDSLPPGSPQRPAAGSPQPQP